jgi:hypothetical protein
MSKVSPVMTVTVTSTNTAGTRSGLSRQTKRKVSTPEAERS